MSSHIQARSALACAIFLLATQLIATIHCQVSDGDEQFEFQHQDIGRISGLSSGSSQVAAQTTVVSRQPQPQQPNVFNGGEQQPPVAPITPAVAQVFERAHATQQSGHGGGHSRASQRSSHTGSQRKPNRITLVPRRDPLPAASQSAGQAQPAALVRAQLPAPPQQLAPTVQFQPAPTTTTLVDELPQPTFAPVAPPTHPHHHQHQQTAVATGPALSSFRATGGSVSARHSALIAQVAAERAAAASQAAAPSLISPAPSFASPTEALSSPQAVAIPADQQPAFASFTSQQEHHHHKQQHQPSVSPNQVGHLAAAPSQPAAFVNQPEEPLVAPSFEQVLGQGCPHKGVFSWENRDHCDRYYMCTNGTFTEEACPNGLAYSQQGAVYQHCAYNWNVNCGAKKTAEPIASPGCPWQFGIFPIVQAGRCSIDYFACEWGVPDTKRCSPEGLFYDDRIKGCQWADQLGCKSEALLNFKCPPEDEDNQFWPFPRYYHTTKDVIVCVNEQPRLVHCTDDQIVDPGSLACMEINKKKQKF